MLQEIVAVLIILENLTPLNASRHRNEVVQRFRHVNV